MKDQLQRQININLQLRRQLEACRKDTVEYCAKWCEDHEVLVDDRSNISGDYYAKGLRGIIGK